MRTTIRRWGNSLALRIPQPHARDLGWADGSTVDLTADRDGLRVRTAVPTSPGLADLVAEISLYNLPEPSAADPGPAAPDRGDLVWLDAGEPGPRVPYLILSPVVYNARTGLALACPVARRIRGYPFEVLLEVEGRTAGAVLADRVEAVAWRQRRAERASVA
ncbi:MAG: AbrB/MazE/SpoVT family DNA-binding domain-containing protein, partial [Krumholzibacteria bacterium]|nr:AbrB/MazE/SpoVT family DNA-binding domain-containing protein [Candidatus Krumholzibacteria bacterium]